ncbi:MAG: hypothetical protein ACI9QC_000645, partial [Oceanicoccus sp.]
VGNALGLNVVEYINLGEVFELISQITSQNSSGGGGGGVNSLD